MGSAVRLVGLASILGCGPSAGTGEGSGGNDGGSGGSSTSSTGVEASGPSTTMQTSASGSTESSVDTTTGPDVPEACRARGWDLDYAYFQQQVAGGGGRYWYTTRRALYETGFSPDCYYSTTIEVDAGAVIRRVLEGPEPASGGDITSCTDAPFDESGDALGSHDTGVAGPLWTGDDVYLACCDDVLAIEPADEYDVGYGTSDDGLLSVCNATAKGCADGCTSGPDGFGNGEAFVWGFGPLPP